MLPAAIAVLGGAGLVDAGEVAALQLLPEAERLPVPSREATPAERELVEVEVDEIPSLDVELLRRLLDVFEEARPVLAKAHRAVDDEELLAITSMSLEALGLVRRRERVHAAGGVAGLVRVFGAVEAHAARVVVVFADDAGVTLYSVAYAVAFTRYDAPRAERGSRTGRSGRAALGLAVHAEAVRREVLRAGERPRRRVVRSPQEEEALRIEAPRRVLGGEPAAIEPELIVGAPRDGEVSLLRRVGSFEDAHRVNELRDDEVRVGVAVAVIVARVVDGNAVDGELEVLPLVRVEAAEEHLLGVARAALVREEKTGRELGGASDALARGMAFSSPTVSL